MAGKDVSANPLTAALGRGFRPAAVRRGEAGAVPPRLRRGAWPRTGPRSTPSPATRRRRASPIPSRRWSAAGALLNQVSNLFFVLAGADTSDAIEAVEREMSPLLARHSNALYLNAALFRRIDELYRAPRQPQAQRRADAGAGALSHPLRARRGWSSTRRRRTGSPPSSNGSPRSAPSSARTCWPTRNPRRSILEEGDLAGLPDFARAQAQAAAETRGHQGKYAITLARSSIESFLQFSARRDLREKAFTAWISRGENGGATDNRAIVAEIVVLRAERARLLGFANFADYRLDDQMAKTPANAARAARQCVGPCPGACATRARRIAEHRDARGR